MSSVADGAPTWSVLVPVKTLSKAKSRLHGHPRPTMMRAFALDTVTAALASVRVASVHVVTDETALAAELAALGCGVLPDEGDGDLNQTLVAAVRRLHGGPVASLLGDLPALRADDLDAALGWAATHGAPCFVADAEGTGTTLLAATDAAAYRPHHGPGSAAAHAAAGYAGIPLEVPTLRRDVDTAGDLQAATRLGVGDQTRLLITAD